MERRKLLILVGIACLILLLAGLPFMAACKAPPTEAKTLRIGALFGLTGFFSAFDIQQNLEVEVARDMMNEDGGIVVNGEHYMIELVVEDFKSTLDGVTAGANKLVYDEGIKFMISPSAFFSSAATPVCEPAKVLRAICFVANSPGELDTSTQYGFLVANASVEHAIGTMTYLEKKHPEVKTVAFVCPDDGATIPYVFPTVRDLLEEHGITVVGDPIGYPNEMVDFTPIATKVIATKADALFLENGVVPHAGGLLKSLREQGSDMLFASTINVNAGEVMAVAGEAASTNFLTLGIMPDAPEMPSLMTDFIQRFYAKHGSGIRSFHFQTVNALWMMKQAIEKAQSLDPIVVRDTWEKMDTFECIYGTGHLGGLKTYGIKHAVSHPDMIHLLDNGEVKFGDWVDVRVP